MKSNNSDQTWFYCCSSLFIVTPSVVLCFVVRYFVSILACNGHDGEERACCSAWFVLLVSRDCSVALPCGAMGLSAVCDCSIS